MSEVLLKPTVVIQNETYRDKVRILKKAENACLITNCKVKNHYGNRSKTYFNRSQMKTYPH